MEKLKKELSKFANPDKAKILQNFFKTKKGQYGEGDIFLGLTSQQIKNIAKQFSKKISFQEIQELLNSKIHEERVLALRILVEKFPQNQKFVYDFYLQNAKKINNWDLVDLSAPKILGVYLLNKKDRKILYELAKSKNLWEKRIAIVSTYTLIKNNQFNDTIKISKILLSDEHDLIHKAVGWMLRELGKKNETLLKKFLKENYKSIPRTTLRYSIERFKEEERKQFLHGKFN